MLSKLRALRPSHTTVVAYLSLFLVLTGGTAFALGGSNTVFSDDITNNEVRTADVRNDNLSGGGLTSRDVRLNALTGNDVSALTGGDVNDNSLTGADVNESTFGQVPSAANAGNAGTLDGKDSTEFLGSAGETRINASVDEWRKTNPASSVTANPGGDGTFFQSGGTEEEILASRPDLPSTIAGKPLRLVGVNACYQTTTDTIVDGVQIEVMRDDGSPHTTQALAQDTNFTDDACRDFLLPTPLALDPQDVVAFHYVVDFPGANDQFIAGRSSFIVKP